MFNERKRNTFIFVKSSIREKMIKGKLFQKMYSREQIQAYLERIRFQGELELTKEMLDKLIYAHQTAIPFENLDVYEFHKKISLKPEALFQKMVTHRRGGYCLEMNGLFGYMLQSMGFDARPCLCRVMFGLNDPSQNLFDHRANIVTLEGKQYFCEVGLGGAMPPSAMELPVGDGWVKDAPDIWRKMRGEEFCIRPIEPGWYGTMRRVQLDRDIYNDPFDRKERLEVMFCMAEVHEMDFISLNYYLSQSDDSMFRQRRVVNLRTAHGYRALTNNTYREVSDGIRQEKELISEELLDILREKFGLNMNIQ